MASQNASFNKDTQSTISSTLSSTSATSVLNQIDAELREVGPQAEETLADNGQQPQQAPKQRQYLQKHFIENKVDRKRLVAWYWAHGNEYECQELNKKGQKDLFWAYNHCSTFKPYLRTSSQHISTHLHTIHRLQENPPALAS
jgi:uncharacterized surface protein with fasciclin (FAS1) repeats